MTVQLQRKQIVVLLLAATLAAASYWIPIPHKPAPLDQAAGVSASHKDGKQTGKSES